MKSIRYSLLVLFFYSCGSSVDNYEGYIYEKPNVPAKDVSVCEKNSSNCTKTDHHGFFKLEKDKKTVRELVVIFKGEPTDTLRTVWSQRGEKINYSFIKGKNDTLFINR